MPINKIGGGSPLQAVPYLLELNATQTFLLPVGQGGSGQFGGAGVPQLGIPGNAFSGQYLVNLGGFSELQVFDQSALTWRKVAGGTTGVTPQTVMVSSDGTNFRVANTTGSPTLNGTITAAGSGATDGFYGWYLGSPLSIVANTRLTTSSVTVSATDGSEWNVIVGGSVNSTISVTGTVAASAAGVLAPFGGATGTFAASGGTGYAHQPLILFGPPPNQGQQPYILPQATCTVVGGAIATVTVTNQGAGLLGLPTITIIANPLDLTAGGAKIGWLVANSGEVGAGTMRQIYLAGYGTSTGTAPTLTISGGGLTAATATATQNATAATADTILIVSL